MKVVNPNEDEPLNFAEYISMHYRQKNKPIENEEREQYRKQYQGKIIVQEENQLFSKDRIRVYKQVNPDGTEKFIRAELVEGKGASKDKVSKLTADTIMKAQHHNMDFGIGGVIFFQGPDLFDLITLLYFYRSVR